MSVAARELPLLLRDAARLAGSVMAMNGNVEWSVRASAPYNYRLGAEQHRGAAYAFMREVVEGIAPDRTLREAANAAFRKPPPETVLFKLVVCDRGRSEDDVQRVQHGDVLYLVVTPRQANTYGLVAVKAAPR